VDAAPEVAAGEPVVDVERLAGGVQALLVGGPRERLSTVRADCLEGGVAVLEPAVADAHRGVRVVHEFAVYVVLHASRNALAICLPRGVRMLSGWNCTPAWGRSR